MKFYKILRVWVLVLLVTFCSGCIVGFPVMIGGFIAGGNPVMIGTGIALVGAGMTVGQKSASEGRIYMDKAGLAILLDDKNPGRLEMLNPLPIFDGLARSLNVSLSDIEHYNDELEQIINIDNQFLETAKNKKWEQFAKKVGALSFDELKSILNQKELGQKELSRFAEASQLTEKTAAIYLKLRLGARIRN